MTWLPRRRGSKSADVLTVERCGSVRPWAPSSTARRAYLGRLYGRGGDGQDARLDIAVGARRMGPAAWRDDRTPHPRAGRALRRRRRLGLRRVGDDPAALAGRNVRLLARAGKAYPPGSFARSPWEIGRSFWDPSEGLQGLFNVWSFRGLGGIVASGLGGGSLVYSNVLIRKDESTFVQDEARDMAGRVRGSRALPRGTRTCSPRPRIRSSRTRRSATRPASRTTDVQDARTGRRRAPRARVAPAEARGGVLGERRAASSRRADPRRAREHPRARADDVPPLRRVQHRLQLRLEEHARLQLPVRRGLRHGASIFTRCEVKTFAPRPEGGYTVGYVDHSQAVEGEGRTAGCRSGHVRSARARRRAFGSTYLLLKNRAAFPQLSDRLGTRSAATATC